MKIARYVIERNQVIDLINKLKDFLKFHDNPENKSKESICPLIKNNHMEVQLKIEKEIKK